MFDNVVHDTKRWKKRFGLLLFSLAVVFAATYLIWKHLSRHESAPDRSMHYYIVGQLYLRHYEQELEKHPNNREIMAKLINSYRLQGQTRKEVMLAGQYVALFPNDPAFPYCLCAVESASLLLSSSFNNNSANTDILNIAKSLYSSCENAQPDSIDKSNCQIYYHRLMSHYYNGMAKRTSDRTESSKYQALSAAEETMHHNAVKKKAVLRGYAGQ